MTTLETTQAALIEEITRRVVVRLLGLDDPLSVVVGVSNRHAHLSREDLRILFNVAELTVRRQVHQPKEFAAEQTVTVHGPKTTFTNVRVMGPCRTRSQVELSKTDCYALGVDAPVTQSGHLGDAAPIDVEGPCGRIRLEHGAIVAARHLHLGPSHATQLGLSDQDLTKIEIGGQRGGIFDNVVVRVREDWIPEIHLDTDEANALNLGTGDRVRLIKE